MGSQRTSWRSLGWLQSLFGGSFSGQGGICSWLMPLLGFPGGSEVKASACNAGDLDSIPRSGRSPGEGNGNSLQYSCLENPMDRGAWWATVHGVAKRWTRLSDFTNAPCTVTSLTRFVSARVNKLQNAGLVPQGNIKLHLTTENITHP